MALRTLFLPLSLNLSLSLSLPPSYSVYTINGKNEKDPAPIPSMLSYAMSEKKSNRVELVARKPGSFEMVAVDGI